MLNSRKKNSRFARQFFFILTRGGRKKNSERNKKPYPPSCKLNGRSLINECETILGERDSGRNDPDSILIVVPSSIPNPGYQIADFGSVH